MTPIIIRGPSSSTLPHAPALLDEMFRLRHAVFKERLNWDVASLQGRERDAYDDLDPVYMVSRDGGGAVQACWRLLPTTGPYMLKDVFPELLGGHPAPRHPAIWEASRFAVQCQERSYRSIAGLHPITKAMILALHEFALLNGVSKIVAVSDLRFERILIRAGASVHRYGPTRRIGNVTAVAGWLEITEAVTARIRDRVHGSRPALH